MNIIDVKESLRNKSIYSLLTPSVFNPTPERLLSRAEKYQADDKVKVYAYSENGEHKGIIEVKINEQTAEILGIAVKPEYQGKGIGTEILKTAIKEHLKNEVHIQCFKTNPVKNLYFKLGFEATEQTQTHIKMKLNKEKYLTYINDAKCSVKKEK